MTKSANWMKIVLFGLALEKNVSNGCDRSVTYVIRDSRLSQKPLNPFFLTPDFHHDIRMCSQNAPMRGDGVTEYNTSIHLTIRREAAHGGAF